MTPGVDDSGSPEYMTCLHRLVERQVSSTPEAIAVRYLQEQLSYRALDRRANGLAHVLASACHTAEPRIGVCLERSLDLVICLLAVLKAGGSYVPLDPETPTHRLRRLAEHVDVVLTDQPGRFTGGTIDPSCGGTAVTGPRVQVSPLQAAYVIYTSGSTGQPKGVINTHAGICNRLQWMQEAYGLLPEDRVLQKTPFTFDVSVWEFFWPLITGATLVIARPRQQGNPDYLSRLVRDERLTHLHFVPSMLDAYLETDPDFGSVKKVFCSGERLTANLANRFLAAHRPELHNLYGPTEAAVDVTAWHCRAPAETVPIGRAIANITMHVLDDSMAPAETGEIHIAGIGLARGYLKQPGLTAAQFVPNPFAAGTRLYRTGDQGRLSADGSIEYLGRRDHQVKIRGHRIELQEIEIAIASIPGVQAVTVVVVKSGENAQQLAACLIGARGAACSSPATVREQLRALLPEFMVPSTVLFCDSFPLLANGKVDRKALAGIAAASTTPVDATPADNATERELADIWGEVLGIPAPGVHANFFDLGGDSLKAIRVSARAARRGLDAPVSLLLAHPTIAGLAAATAKSPFIDGPRATSITDESEACAYPLTPMQAGMLFHTLHRPEQQLYLLQFVFHLSGNVKVAQLRAACEAVIQRHAALRTSFAYSGDSGEPFQTVAPQVAVPFRHVDLQTHSEAHAESRLQELLVQDRSSPFRVDRAPLIRFSLVRTAAARFTWTITHLHLIMAEWDLLQLLREIFTVYNALESGRSWELPPAHSFSHFVRYLQARDTSEAQAFWRAYLRDVRPSPLPILTPAGRQAPDFREIQLALPGARHQAIRDFSRRHRLTTNTTLTAAFALLLRSYCDTDDITFGLTVSGRSAPVDGIEGMIGLTINTVPLRVPTSRTSRLTEWLVALQENVFRVHEHEHTPLVEARRAAALAGDTSLFEALLVFDEEALDELVDGLCPSLAVRAVEMHEKSNYPLTFCVQKGTQLLVRVVFDQARLQSQDAVRLAEEYAALLTRLLSEPGTLGDMLESPAVPEPADFAERRGFHASVPELFLERCRQAPDAVAIVSGERTLTYRAVEQVTAMLARELRCRLAAGERRVGILMRDRLQGVVAMLAVLRAGQAYVPLDTELPRQRLERLVDEAAVDLVLALRSEDLARDITAPVLWMDALPPSDPVHDVPAAPFADNLAYITFTSGSTGRPRGVAVTHRSIVNLVIDNAYVRPGPRDRILHAANTAFDAATFEIWGALLSGACLVIAERADILEPSRFAALLARSRTSCLFLTTALFQLMMDEAPAAFRDVTTLLFGGERCDPRRVVECLAASDARVLHVYGPTETTTFATWHHVTSLPGNGAQPPIGRPLSGASCYVLDESLRPVAEGHPGELYIGGLGVARGYANSSTLTAASFVPDCFAGHAGSRMYRTGDRVRVLADGAIEFLDRADNQLKIRGHRVEIGEIEAALVQHPRIRSAAVKVDRRGDEVHLHACLVLEPGTHLDAATVSRHLQQSLPGYMVPAHVHFLDALPLNPSGKVDRGALPSGAAPSSRRGVPPRSPLEELVAGMWCSVLGLDFVGVHDDFYDLGGHSLLASRLAARLEYVLGKPVPVTAVLAHPTVAELCQAVAGTQTTAPVLGPRDPGAGLPLSSAQERMWFVERMAGRDPVHNIAFSMHLRGRVDHGALAGALQDIVDRHEILQVRITTHGGRPVQELAPWRVPLPVVDVGSDAALHARMQQEADTPFELGRGRLFTATLYRLAGDHHVLFINVHHIVADGWSLSVLLDELGERYTRRVEGRPEGSTALAIQYVDYAAWQGAWLAGGDAAGLVEYWKQQLRGAPSTIGLLTDNPRPPILTFGGAVERFEVDADTTSRLQAISRSRRATLFMTLFTAFAVFLRRVSGQEELVIGSPLANRNHGATEDLIGLFVNLVLLRVRVTGTYADLLGQVRRTCLEAFEHQDLPFEKLVHALQPARTPDRHPLTQVLFALQSFGLRGPSLRGLQADAPDFLIRTVKCDLECHVYETADGLTGHLVYNRDLFLPGTIRSLARSFTVLLRAVAEDAERNVRAYPLLPESERWGSLLGRSESRASSRQSIHRIFEAQAAARPDATAVTYGALALSYGALNRRANQLARHLCDRGVRPQDTVALCMAPSPAFLVGALAILKAGGIYLPLDPTYPEQRLQLMVRTSRAAMLLTSGSAPPWSDIASVDVEHEPAIGRYHSGNLPMDAGEEWAAYLIYTSGSTGVPKGTVVPHLAVTRLVLETDYVDLTPSDRVAQASNLAFDAATFEIWGALLNGAQLVGIDRETLLSPARLAEQLRCDGISTMFVTTALFNRTVVAQASTFASLRHVLFGGELVDPAAVDRCLQAPPQRLLHVYGPTENTTFSTWHQVRDVTGRTVPIGRPISGTCACVLDEAGEPVPRGAIGELYLGGTGLATCYHAAPALTAERFVPDALSGSPGQRLYRTGDVVRPVESGVEFSGRIDRQVKIRGFRIEPGETEAVLLSHKAVANAVVCLRDDPRGDPALAAYVEPRSPGSLTSSALRSFLAKILPVHLLPATITILDTLPLNPNGKVDTSALPAPDFARSDATYQPPGSLVEREIAGLWCRLLGVERVGLTDSFFELGGHSLLAVTAVAELSAILGRELSVVLLFRYPTVESLAAALTEESSPSGDPTAGDRAHARRQFHLRRKNTSRRDRHER